MELPKNKKVIKSFIVNGNKSDDVLNILDGRNSNDMEYSTKMPFQFVMNNILYFCPYVGYINTSDFPSLEPGEIKDEKVIGDILNKTIKIKR